MPLAGAVNTPWPLASSASGAPLTVSVRAATAEKASASTLIATGCPGTAGKLGVSTMVGCGPVGWAVTRSARPRSTVVMPSVTPTTAR